MGWEALIVTALDIMAIADRIITYVKTLPGVSAEEVDKVVARNRAERAARLVADRAREWPDE